MIAHGFQGTGSLVEKEWQGEDFRCEEAPGDSPPGAQAGPQAQSQMTTGPVKVFFVTFDFEVGGAQNFLVSLLCGFDRRKVRPIVVSLGPRGPLEERIPADVPFHRFRRRWRYDMKPAQDIASLLREENITCGFAINVFCYFYLRRAAKLSQNPGRTFISQHSTLPRTFKDRLWGYASARLLDDAETVITICRSQTEYLSGRYGIPLSRFVTIYNGIDTSHWSAPPPSFDRAQFRSAQGIPERAFVIVQAAAIRPEKRHEDSLHALACFRRMGGGMPYLLLVGAGDAQREKSLRSLAAGLEVADHVRFCGMQAYVRPFYWMADAFTLSSDKVETFSLAALEAMSTGLPCILTDVGGACEMIIEGVNGLLVPPRNPPLLARGWSHVIESRDTFKSDEIRRLVCDRFALDRCVSGYTGLLSGNEHDTRTSVYGLRFQDS